MCPDDSAPRPITIPLRTGSGLNDHRHWRVRAKHVKSERRAVAWALQPMDKPAIPCTVILTRVAPSSGLDDDNLIGALKSVRDQVAHWLGVDDRHHRTVRYAYRQQRGPWGVKIEFGEPVTGAQLAFNLS